MQHRKLMQALLSLACYMTIPHSYAMFMVSPPILHRKNF